MNGRVVGAGLPDRSPSTRRLASSAPLAVSTHHSRIENPLFANAESGEVVGATRPGGAGTLVGTARDEVIEKVEVRLPGAGTKSTRLDIRARSLVGLNSGKFLARLIS